jgi:hypothetical protein
MLLCHTLLIFLYTQGKPCCNEELYFFTPKNEMNLNLGIRQYRKFFETPTPQHQFLYAAEKTPVYSYCTLSPYRAGVFLKRPIKLIFTIRDPIEADQSLYLFRAIDFKYKVNYLEWIEPRVKIIHEWMKCRETKLKEILVPNFKDQKDYFTLHELTDPNKIDWRVASQIEHYLYKFCQRGNVTSATHFTLYDFIQERLYAQNLKRWAHVFGKIL